MDNIFLMLSFAWGTNNGRSQSTAVQKIYEILKEKRINTEI